MSVIRLIFTTVPPEAAPQAERNWKEKCATLMIRQPGCLSEQLLRCKNSPGEFISYSEWDSEESIQKYLQSEDHKDIKRHNTNIKGVKVEVKHYELVR